MGVIHTDIRMENVLTDGSMYFFSDFDNCNFKKYTTNIKYTSPFTKNYVNKYGFNKDLDIYLFNLMTYAILNGVSMSKITDIIGKEKNYGIFNNNDSILVCKSLLLEDRVFNNDFLIDTIKTL